MVYYIVGDSPASTRDVVVTLTSSR